MSSERSVLTNEVVELMRVLHPVADSFVVVGGVATFLYDFHELADPAVQIKTNYTFDIDLAVKTSKALFDQDVHAKLEGLGFSQHISRVLGSDKPLTKFVKEVNGEQFEVEFLVPLTGSEVGRDKQKKVLKAITPHISAQQLRYLDFLLQAPVKIPMNRISSEEADRDLWVQVPHPANYLVHKFITLHRRKKNEEKQKDAFYIYDILNRFEPNWSKLSQSIRKLSAGPRFPKKFKAFEEDFENFFSTEDAEGVALILEEHKRSYAGAYALSGPQVASYFVRFISILKGKS